MALPAENIRALDQLRQRLQQMSTSLNILQHDLSKQETLPTWDALQTRAGLLAGDLGQLQTIFDTNREFLTAAHPYPHANFPGHSQEAVLQQLLRKKAEPAVDEWLDDNTNPAKVAKWNKTLDTGLKKGEQEELWAFAKPTSAEKLVALHDSGALDYEYTLAEKAAGVQNVVTGLRRKLKMTMGEDDEDDEDEDDDEMEDRMEDPMEEDAMGAAQASNDPFGQIKGIDKSKSAMPIDTWVRSMATARRPPEPAPTGA